MSDLKPIHSGFKIDRRRLLATSAAATVVGMTHAPTAAVETSSALPETFINPPGSPAREGSFGDWSSFFYRRLIARQTPPELPPGHVLGREKTEAGIRALNGDNSITWLGHACFLIRLAGTSILTDPYLTAYASPVAPFGPKRFAPAGLAPDQMPPVDIILASHNHYDHLDMVTLENLNGVSRSRFVAPARVPAYLKSGNVASSQELQWHQSIDIRGLQITAVPAIHSSSRSLFDRNESLWAGFTISDGSKVIYFAGDTGYGPVFQNLDLPKPDLAIIPIGAYEPRKLMRAVHCTPEEAVQIGQDIGARELCGMHWGTINLTDEPAFEPPERFKAAAEKAGFGDRAWVMAIGETRRLG